MAITMADWPLASEAGDAVADRTALERPESHLSNTSRNEHRIPMLRASNAIKSNPVPSFHFPRTASAGSSTRPPTRHGLKRPFDATKSVSSESTSNDGPVSEGVRDDSSKRVEHGLASQLSRGAQVFSSAGSFFPFKSEEPPKTRISAPFGFRHVARAEHGGGPMGGTDHGPDADPQATLNQTHRVLLDVRSNSHMENRTSLPVAMPNVTSPIDEGQFDAGCGHHSSRNSFNPFPSQTNTPATVQVHRPDHPPAASCKRAFSLPRIDISKYIKPLNNNWRIAFYTAIISAQITVLSTSAAIALMVQHANDHEVVPINLAVGLALSVAFCFVSLAAIVITYARRRTCRVMESHRNSQNEEELMEMRGILRHSTPTPIRLNDPAVELEDMTQRHVLGIAIAGQSEKTAHLSGRITAPEQAYIRQSSRIVAQGLHNLAAPPNSTQSRRVGGIYDSQSVRTALVAQSIIKGQPFGVSGRAVTTPIGVARSDSLLHSAVYENGVSPQHREVQQQAIASDNDKRADERNRSHSTESDATEATYESVGTDTPMIAEKSSPPLPHASEPSKDEKPMPAVSETGGIPHSVAVADLSAKTNVPALPSVETKSTLSSLVDSYADENEKDQVDYKGRDAAGSSYIKTYNAPHPNEALGSHPVQHGASRKNPFKRLQELPKPPHKIVTEAGTPESQKGTERFPAYVERAGANNEHHREAIQSLQSIRAPMTPIVERSESPIAIPNGF
ncbi:hypothetical protein PG995_016321 [Apiospora arundinis]